jgi:hypothetical protein
VLTWITAAHIISSYTAYTTHLFLYFTAYQRGHTQRSSSLIPIMTCVQYDHQLWSVGTHQESEKGPLNDNLVDEGDNSVT